MHTAGVLFQIMLPMGTPTPKHSVQRVKQIKHRSGFKRMIDHQESNV